MGGLFTIDGLLMFGGFPGGGFEDGAFGFKFDRGACCNVSLLSAFWEISAVN